MKLLYIFSTAFFLVLFGRNSVAQVNLDSGLVGCYPFSGNANDMSGNNHNGIVSGASLTNDRFGSPNSAYLFNGTSDFIAINHFDSLSSSDELSISFWAKADVETSNSVIMLSPDSDEDRLVCSVEYNGTIYWDYGNIFNTGRSTVSESYTTNWNHYVFIISQSKNLKQVYENDTLVINTTYGSSLVKRNKTLLIGGGTDEDQGNIRFHGSIDDIRIFNRSVTNQEVYQLYSSATINCSAPTQPNCLVLCLPFKGNAVDYSGYHHNGIVSGATLTTDRFNNPNSAYLFNGTSDFIAINNFDSISSSNELSIAFWAKADGETSNSVVMLSPDSEEDRLVCSVEYEGSIYWDYGNIFTSGRSTVSDNYTTDWNHYVFVVSQSQNLKQVYKNDTLLINTTYGSSLVKRNKTLLIGGGTDANEGNIRFHGSIGDFQVFNCALSSTEVSQVYNGLSCYVNITTDINDLNLPNVAVKAYPNPSNGQFSVDLGNSSNEKMTISICNTLGQVVYSAFLQPGNSLLSVDLTGSATNGIYSLILQNDTGRKVQKLIISR